MKRKTPLEKMIDQVAILTEMVQIVQKAEMVEELPKDIDQRLKAIEEGVALFKQINDEIFDEVGIEEKDLRKYMKATPPGVPAKQRRLLDRARNLRKEIEFVERGYARALDIAKHREKTFGKKGTKKGAVQARKKKFKRTGSKKGWMPL